MEGIRLTAKQTQKYYAPIAMSKLYEHRENFIHIVNNASKRRRYAISEKSGIKIYNIYNNESEKKNKKEYKLQEEYKNNANIQAYEHARAHAEKEKIMPTASLCAF